MKIRKISEVLGKRVFTDSGEFFGEVEEVNLFENRIDGWRIRVSNLVTSVIGGARGVIIPHQFVKSIGDVFIINNGALPSAETLDEGSEELM
jgi:sporulation protein YlmC with PRC-barrel domain